MKMTQKRITASLEKLKKHFGFEELHTYESSDKYGTLFHIEEFKLCVYKQDLALSVDHLISSYDYATSEKALKALKKMAKKDNHFANYLSYREYEIIKVRLLENNWFGVQIRFKDNGEIRNFLETGLSCALNSEKDMERYLSYYNRFFVAGGLEKKDVDFIFHGVGHSTHNKCYSFSDEWFRVIL